MYDAHTHFIPEEVLGWLKENKSRVNAEWKQVDPAKADFLSVNGKWAFELKESFVSKQLFLEGQQQGGVKHSLLSPIPQLFLYEFPVEITQELVGVYNRSLADWCKAEPDRVAAIGTVSLNDPETAAADLRNAMNLGLKGAIIGPGHDGKLLSDPTFQPLWDEANRLGAVLFIHPLLNTDPRLQKRMMPNLIGVPFETTICATDILLSGLMDKSPNAKVLLAHGGGFLPYQIGRITKGYQMWPQVSSVLQAEPLDYLKRFWFDSVVWNPQTLQYLVDLVGADRVVGGSDYPFDLCELPVGCKTGEGYRSLVGI